MFICKKDYAIEWDYDKNLADISPQTTTHGSHKRIWWKCSKGHSWQATPNDRSKGNGCPYCWGRLATSSNNLLVSFSDIASQLHPRNKISASSLTPSSNKKVWWICDKGHEWITSISGRTNNGSGCPYCSGRMATPEDNLAVLFPYLIYEWDKEKNGKLCSEKIKAGSHKRIWWKCSKGHSWQMSPKDRTGQGQGCPYCSGRRAGQGNTLADMNPIMSLQWHPTKNKELTPLDVTSGSHKRVWWKCSKGHEWFTSISGRKRSGCPYCTGRYAFHDNNLTTTHSKLSREWNYKRNGKLKPKDVVAGSHKEVWWICDKGHEWKSKVYARSKLKSQCPSCSARMQVSKLELRVYSEVLYVFKNARHGEKINGREMDIFLPEHLVAIEVDGWYWHKNNEEKDKQKNDFLLSKGITLLRFRERPLKKIMEQDVLFSDEGCFEAIAELIEIIGCGKDYSWYRKSGKFLNNKFYLACLQNLPIRKGRSLKDRFPLMANNWHPTKNGILTPDKVSYGSKFDAWWLGECGHEWNRKVNYCTSKKSNNMCPICSGHKKIKQG